MMTNTWPIHDSIKQPLYTASTIPCTVQYRTIPCCTVHIIPSSADVIVPTNTKQKQKQMVILTWLYNYALAPFWPFSS